MIGKTNRKLTNRSKSINVLHIISIRFYDDRRIFIISWFVRKVMSTLLDTRVSLPRILIKYSNRKPCFYGFTSWTATDTIANCFVTVVRPISELPFCSAVTWYVTTNARFEFNCSPRTDGVDGKYLANIVGKENKK